MTIYYAGIGSRETPEDIRRKMFAAARTMATLGFVLRSGGAKGADTAFEQGCDAAQPPGRKQIFLPYKGFNRNPSPFYGTTPEARALARRLHPNWPVIGDNGRDFLARNGYQILGPDLRTPSNFVLLWTKGGEITGGTGQAMRVAIDSGIPILNLATDADDYISDFILQQSKG